MCRTYCEAHSMIKMFDFGWDRERERVKYGLLSGRNEFLPNTLTHTQLDSIDSQINNRTEQNTFLNWKFQYSFFEVIIRIFFLVSKTPACSSFCLFFYSEQMNHPGFFFILSFFLCYILPAHNHDYNHIVFDFQQATNNTEMSSVDTSSYANIWKKNLMDFFMKKVKNKIHGTVVKSICTRYMYNNKCH